MNTEKIDESYGYGGFGNVWPFLNVLGNLFGPDAYSGQIWNPILGNGGVGFTDSILNVYKQAYFTVYQRVQGQYLYINNPYAISAVDNLVNMVMSGGFQYVCDSDAEQKRLDDWIHNNNYHWRAREAFQKLLVQGEVFIRIFEDGETIRFVSPVMVFDGANNGIITDEYDYEQVLEYVLSYNGKAKNIPAEEMQHRKNSWCEDKRGVSILYPVAGPLTQAMDLLVSIAGTAKSLSKFAAVRTSDASKASVQTMRGDIQAQQNAQFPNLPNYKSYATDNVEQYSPGTILDVPAGVKVEFPGQQIDGAGYIDVLRALLRQIAARVGLPESVLSQDQDSIAAYSGQMVADSHISKGLRNWQERLGRWDLELFKMCGFNIAKIHVEYPDVATNPKNEAVNTGEFLLRNKLACKSTVASSFGLDYDEEVVQMQSEDANTPDALETKPQDTYDPKAYLSQGENKDN